MLLKGKTAIVYGGGAIGETVVWTFARGRSKVLHRRRTLQGRASTSIRMEALVDIAAKSMLLDPSSVSRHTEHVVAASGRIDVSLNAIGIIYVQGPPFAELSLDDFLFPTTLPPI